MTLDGVALRDRDHAVAAGVVLIPQDNGLAPILTAVQLNSDWVGKAHYFEKVSDRRSWDFPLANVAAVLDIQDGTVQAARIVVGGVAARPLRMRRAETLVTGRRVDDATLEEAAQAAVQGARPLQYNAYKVALTRNLVKRAIREARA